MPKTPDLTPILVQFFKHAKLSFHNTNSVDLACQTNDIHNIHDFKTFMIPKDDIAVAFEKYDINDDGTGIEFPIP